MSRDFSPKEQYLAHLLFPDLHFSNFVWVCNGKETPFYTPEELEDRKSHPYIHIMGADIYKVLKDKMSEEAFSELNKTLGELAEADRNKESTARFPKEIVDWYYNRHGHYYHEPNDEEFIKCILRRKR